MGIVIYVIARLGMARIVTNSKIYQRSNKIILWNIIYNVGNKNKQNIREIYNQFVYKNINKYFDNL